jgi:hypothetical protein
LAHPSARSNIIARDVARPYEVVVATDIQPSRVLSAL